MTLSLVLVAGAAMLLEIFVLVKVVVVEFVKVRYTRKMTMT